MIKPKSIYTYSDYRAYLSEFYRLNKERTRKFSHRYIESKVNVSAGYFSRVLNGTKNISEAVMARFANFISLNKKETAYFEAMVKYNQAKDSISRARHYEKMMENLNFKASQLTKERYAFFQEPHHVVIHALINKIKISNHSNLDDIGKLLTPVVSGKKVKDSLKLLKKLSLITEMPDGSYGVTKTMLTTGSNPGDITLRKYIIDSLSHAISSLDQVPVNERSASVMTISISDDAYSQINQKLQSAREEINNIISRDKNISRVYQLSMSLIPVSKKLTERTDNELKK